MQHSAVPVRLGAVGYLNARPLVYGLELKNSLFSVRFDVPSKCAALLHENAIDVGMIPSIEFLRGHEAYTIAPGLGIMSDGPVASVALFSAVPIEAVRTIAADTSSRTSTALVEILCYERFGVEPELVPMAPDPAAMLARCDAALIIGDPALFLDPADLGVRKIDLGEEWTEMTGLPFVWAFWAGRPGALSPEAVAALAAARDAGVKASDRIAADYCSPDQVALGQTYLKDNINYHLGAREEAGLRRYYELALKHEVVGALRPLVFY
jgi:chorismate dehydratase